MDVAREAPAPPAAAGGAPTSLPRRADVLVVGAGVVGLCVAHYLTEAGRRVAVIDQGEAGAGASRGNAGLIAPSHGLPLPSPAVIRSGLRWMLDSASPFYVRPRLDPDLFRWLVHFGLASTRRRSQVGAELLCELLTRSADLFDELSQRPGIECEYRADGVLNVYATVGGFEGGQAEVRRLAGYGLASRVLSAEQARELEPALGASMAGAVLWPQDRHLDPELLVERLAASLDARGARVHDRTEVLSFRLEGGRVGSVRTTGGDIEAAEVVLAAGAWSTSLSRRLGLHLPVQPAKGYSITSVARGLLPQRPILFADAKVVATPLAGRLRLAGTLELVGLDASISDRRVEAVRAVGQRCLPGVELEPQGRVWRGLRALSADGLPLIGRPRSLANLTVATGHGHLGVSLAPVTGRLVADLLDGRRPWILDRLSPDRFGAHARSGGTV